MREHFIPAARASRRHPENPQLNDDPITDGTLKAAYTNASVYDFGR
jgi:hypothetical protein